MPEFCNMQILVVAATEMEIAPFLAQHISVDHLITGVGVPACMYRLQKKVQQKKYDCIIQAGIAGSFTQNIALGETVLVERDCFADLGIFENNKLISLFDAGFVNKNEMPYKNGWLVNETGLLNHFSLPKLTAVTVNMVTEQKMLIDEYRKLYEPAIETMEGAALHYTCLMENIPFLQLRTISNMVGERDKSKWKILEAVHNLNNHLLEITEVLKQHS